MTTKSSRALHTAHALSAQLKTATWSGIVKYAWYFERLRTWMSTDIVAFSYWKKDGTIREAHGTLNSALIPEDKRPKGDSKPRKPNYLCFAYFDVDKQEWRSFTLDKFIGFVSIGASPTWTNPC